MQSRDDPNYFSFIVFSYFYVFGPTADGTWAMVTWERYGCWKTNTGGEEEDAWLGFICFFKCLM